MFKRDSISLVLILSACLAFSACGRLHKPGFSAADKPLTRIDQIDSFKVATACGQALEVLNNNRYSQNFFEKVFARIIDQCESSKSPKNADIIWNNFVKPLKSSGKVPPDLAVTTWNYYFSADFASLPENYTLRQSCSNLTEIKNNIGREYRLKIKGFDVTQQGSPDADFGNAMRVYNTIWAACHGVEE